MTGEAGVLASEACATLTIDLGALVANWRICAARAAPGPCAAVLKADAYGTGLEQAGAALSRAGCDTFFVAHVSEGRRLRAVLREAAILVLNGLPTETAGLAAFETCRLSPVLGSPGDIARWRVHASETSAPAAIHVDTGINRLGLTMAELAGFAGSDAGFDVAFLMSHLASSEDLTSPQTAEQIAIFRDASALLAPVPTSLANSSALFREDCRGFGLARPGYALYGGNPTPGQPNPMRPVVRLEAPIIRLRSVPAGATSGYNAQWRARRPSVLATIGVGYADGLPRNAMNTPDKAGGEALVLGQRVPFAGRVSMDLIVLDVTDVASPGLAPGTPAHLLGPTITVDDLAQRSLTIGYEILTGLGSRYERRYVCD